MAGLRSSEHGTSATNHAQQVETVKAMAQQIRNCHFKPNDIFVEYSLRRNFVPLDMGNIRRLLQHHGFNDRELIPQATEHPGDEWITAIRRCLSQVLPISCWKLQYLFRLLFPRDPLVDKNHSATIDCLQLARIVRLVAELAKPAENRDLPSDLLQGLKVLPRLGQPEQKNTKMRATAGERRCEGKERNGLYSLFRWQGDTMPEAACEAIQRTHSQFSGLHTST
jgi:hypothetical protein